MNPEHILTTHFATIYPNGLLPLGFPNILLCHFLICHMRDICLANFIWHSKNSAVKQRTNQSPQLKES
jgi:hypothetical protein